MKKLILLILLIPALALAGSIQQQQLSILSMYDAGGGEAPSGQYYEDDFSTDTISSGDWVETTGDWVRSVDGYVQANATQGLLTYDAGQLDTADGYIRFQWDTFANYGGVAFRSTNDTSDYMYVIRFYATNTVAWRRCDDNTTTCTDLATDTMTTPSATEWIQVDFTGTGDDTVIEVWNLGSSPAERGSEGAADITFTTNPGAYASDTGKYIHLYNGSSSSPQFEAVAFGDQ